MPREEIPVVSLLKRTEAYFERDNDGYIVMIHPSVQPDEVAAAAGKLKRLAVFNCHKKPLTNAGLRNLSNLPTLHQLELIETEVTGVGLEGFGELRELSCDIQKDIDKGMEYIGRIRHLRRLCLEHSGVTDESLRHLVRLKELRELPLSMTKLSGSGLKYLTELKELREMSLSQSSLNDVGCLYLGKLIGLERLFIDHTNVTDKGVAHLGNLKSLRCLGLPPLSDEGVRHLAGLTNLESLFLTGPNITDAGLDALHGLKRLTNLWLSKCSRITPAAIARFRNAVPGCEVSPGPGGAGGTVGEGDHRGRKRVTLQPSEVGLGSGNGGSMPVFR